jgi:hypothetical protein
VGCGADFVVAVAIVVVVVVVVEVAMAAVVLAIIMLEFLTTEARKSARVDDDKPF